MACVVGHYPWGQAECGGGVSVYYQRYLDPPQVARLLARAGSQQTWVQFWCRPLLLFPFPVPAQSLPEGAEPWPFPVTLFLSLCTNAQPTGRLCYSPWPLGRDFGAGQQGDLAELGLRKPPSLASLAHFTTLCIKCLWPAEPRNLLS